MTSPHIYRSASKGKPFTVKEKTNIILNDHTMKENAAVVAAFIATEKNKLAKEREEVNKAIKIRHALLAHPNVKKIQTKKSGELYYQERIGGKFAPAVTL